ncbi:hypothetical protein QJQ45_009363 [Haematococcus lacustris]|nr:hypothetical protein QJQ45_009363 [Haematococcus lacustris]
MPPSWSRADWERSNTSSTLSRRRTYPCTGRDQLPQNPNGLKATARRANDIAQEVQAENELLMTEAQLLHAIEEVLAAKMHDLEEKHQHLQAAHRQLRLDNESLEAIIEQCNMAISIARRDVHRLEAQLRKLQRRPLLTRKQRQQLQILKQTGVSIEVLRRWADSNCSRLDTHGRPGGTTVQPTPRPSPPEPTPGPSPPEPCDPFIPTQEASPGQPAARTAAYTAQQYLSTARLMLKTQVSRRRLSTCRRLFITEQCVVANTHRPGERTTVSRQLRVVYKYLRQRTLGASGSGQQDQGQGQAAKVVIAERRQVIKAALRGLVEAALPDLSPAQVDAIVAEVNKRMTMGSKQCVLAAVMSLSVLLQSFLGRPTPGFPAAAGPASGPPPPPDPAHPPYAHPRIATRSSPRTAAAPAQLPPPVQLGIWDPQLLAQIKDAMELLTKASVIEHMMRGPHHHGIRLLPGEVAVFEQPSSAWPVAMLKQLDEEHLAGDGNSLNANATNIITSIKEFYRHPGRFILLGRLDYSLPDRQHKWRLPANSMLRQPRWKEEVAKHRRLLGLPATWREGQDSIGKGGAGRLPIEKRVRYVLFVNRSLEGWQAAHDTCPRPFTMLPMVGVRARHFVIDDRVLHGVLTDLGMTKLTTRQFEADSLPHWQKFIQYSQLQNSGWEFARRVETDGVNISVHFVRSQAVTEPVELPFIGRKLTATSDYDPTTHIAVGLDPGVTQAIKAGHAQRHQVTGQVVNGMKWVSRHYYHQDRGVAVFLGAGNFSQGGWKAGAVREGFRKVVEQPSRPTADPRPDRLVIVDEFRTSRVSSSVHARQPCELHLPPNQPRPADWVRPTGQVNPRLVRPAWSLRHAKYVRGLSWCHQVPPNPPPPAPAQDPPAPAQGPPAPAQAPPAPAQPPHPPPAQAPPPPPPAQAPPPPPPAQAPPAQAPPPPPAQAQPLPAAPGPAPPPQAPPGGRWLDRDTNGCLNLQRIGESRQRPIELCIWDDLEALPPIGKEYQQRYKRINDRLPKGRQWLHRAAEYRRGIDGRARNNA